MVIYPTLDSLYLDNEYDLDFDKSEKHLEYYLKSDVEKAIWFFYRKFYNHFKNVSKSKFLELCVDHTGYSSTKQELEKAYDKVVKIINYEIYINENFEVEKISDFKSGKWNGK